MERLRDDRVRQLGKALLIALLAGVVAPAQDPAPQPGPAAAAAPETAQPPAAGVVTANILVVRARPAAHYERIGQFARGDKVAIVGTTADWLEVTVPPDTRAWIAAQYLSPEGVVTADQVRLHSGPGLVFTTFVSVKQGTKLDVLGPPIEGWQQVRAPVDATAWVSRAYIRLLEPEVPAAPEPPAAAPAAPAETKSDPGAVPEAKPETTAPAETAATEAKPEVAAPVEAAAGTAAETNTEIAPAPAAPVETVASTAETPAADGQDKPAADVPAETEAQAAVPTEAGAPGSATAPPVAPAAAAPEAAAAAPAAPAPTDTTSVTEPPAVPPGTPTTPAPDAPVLMKEGVLLSLKSQASEMASHVLCMRVGNTAYPVCYLKSMRMDLSEWENRTVRVYGREVRLPGWSLAVLHVESIQVVFD